MQSPVHVGGEPVQVDERSGGGTRGVTPDLEVSPMMATNVEQWGGEKSKFVEGRVIRLSEIANSG